jgi:hypothetical protein
MKQSEAVRKYIGNCTHLDGEDIQEMVDNSKSIVFQTFHRNIDGGKASLADVFPDYAWRKTEEGMRMQFDWHVKYFKSVYKGKSCYFVVHSGIEYVWC